MITVEASATQNNTNIHALLLLFFYYFFFFYKRDSLQQMWICASQLRGRTLVLMLQWQQTVHRYLRVLHSRMMKRPPKNVTMEEARNAHHMRCPLLSQGTSDENGMTTSSILDIKIEESGLILLMILLVLIELSLPWGTVPSASASI